MSRLPVVGGDDNNWGSVLNDFLSQSHNADGSLKTSSVTASGVLATLDTRYQIPAIFSRSGTLTVTAGAGRFYVPYSSVIQGVVASVGTPSTGASIICDVNLNGTTIFTTQGNRPTIAAAASKVSSTAVPDVTSMSAGDLLSVDVDQIGSGTAGSDLTVIVLFAR